MEDFRNIHPSATLTPHTAEQVADSLRSELGLGQAYHLSVRKEDDGNWTIDDQLGGHFVRPQMTLGDFQDWFRSQYRDVISDLTETSEG